MDIVGFPADVFTMQITSFTSADMFDNPPLCSNCNVMTGSKTMTVLNHIM